MAHLFSQVHYRKHKKPDNEIHYHGDACELIMQKGIGLSARVKALKMVIGLKRNSLQTIRNTNRYGFTSKEMMWLKVEEARNDPRPIAELQSQLQVLEVHLAYLKLNYEGHFMISRNFDPEHIARVMKYGKERINRRFPKFKLNRGEYSSMYQSNVPQLSFVETPETWPEYQARTKDMGKHLNFPSDVTVRMKGKDHE